MIVKIAKHADRPRTAFEGLGPDTSIHGITDGSWSFIDAIRELLQKTGPAGITISTWTAANADIRQAERMLTSKLVLSWRMLVDRSFMTRQPKYCALAREVFGDDAIRVWNCHSKFCVIEGEKMRLIYLTSANLNLNRRIESYSLFAVDSIVDEYLDLVNSLYNIQKPGEGFSNPKVNRRHTARIMT